MPEYWQRRKKVKIYIFEREVAEDPEAFAKRFNEWQELHREINIKKTESLVNSYGSLQSILVWWQ